MKNKILAIVAVGLLAGPMAANATLIKYTGNAGADGSYLTIEAVVSSTSQGTRVLGGGLESWVMTAFAGTGTVQGVVDSDNPFFSIFGGFGSFIRFDASGLVDAWELIGYHTDSSSGSCNQCWSGFQSAWGDWDFTGTVEIFDPGTWTSVPEPSTLALLSLGLFGLGFARRRRLN